MSSIPDFGAERPPREGMEALETQREGSSEGSADIEKPSSAPNQHRKHDPSPGRNAEPQEHLPPPQPGGIRPVPSQHSVWSKEDLFVAARAGIPPRDSGRSPTHPDNWEATNAILALKELEQQMGDLEEQYAARSLQLDTAHKSVAEALEHVGEAERQREELKEQLQSAERKAEVARIQGLAPEDAKRYFAQRDEWADRADAAERERDGLHEQLQTAQAQLAEIEEQAPPTPDEWHRLNEQLETTQRILIEERRWISDARAWYRDHRSSKGGIYDENTWGDPFAVPGEAEVPASPADLSEPGAATATERVSSPDSLRTAAEAYRDAWYLGEDATDERIALFQTLSPEDFIPGTTTLKKNPRETYETDAEAYPASEPKEDA